ncbi:MAG TPA: FHA domain-containing protein [Streptosporangiales bacterium]
MSIDPRQQQPAGLAAATGPLAVLVNGGRQEFRPGATVLIGRSPDCQVRIDDGRVSRHHAQLAFEEGGWTLRDLGSRNGTYVGPTRIVRLAVAEPCAVRLGNAASGPMLVLQPPGGGTVMHGTMMASPETPVLPDFPPAQRGGPASTHDVTTRVRLGRAPDNDVVLSDLLVSRHHTEVRRTSQGGFEVVDLGSRNGTYLNGRRVNQAPFTPGDLLSVGHHQFVLQDGRLAEYVDEGRVSLRAENLSVAVEDGKIILDQVGFTLDECSLLAVVGPSGAGKSTMLNALTGAKPAQAGRVVYEGRDLYDNYEDLRHRIGLVPQDDILHRRLTVRRALEFAAALRFPDDVSATERAQRIGETCASLGLLEHMDKRIDKLSGGQRKRVSVALELLTRPSLLFLDEPTSGLDPGLDKQVMTELRTLADEGRTVIVVTHSVLNLDLCDRVLLLAPGGKVAYFGPPGQPLLDQFGVSDYSSVFQTVTNEPDRWQLAFRDSPFFRQYGCAPDSANEFERVAASGQPGKAHRQQNVFRQFSILCRRMLAVIVSDKAYAGFICGMPFALALLAHAIPGSHGLAPPPPLARMDQEAFHLVSIIVLGAIFMGTATSVRELVGEVPIYRRERSVGLSPSAYLASKMAVFGAINAVQALVFVLLAQVGRDFPKDPVVLPYGWLEVVVATALLAIASAAIGLLISARVATSEQTMPTLVVAVMIQFGLSGLLFKITGRVGLEQISWLVPARWSTGAIAATLDLDHLQLLPTDDPLWKHDATTWILDVTVLILLIVLVLIGTRLMLLRHEPSRRSGVPIPQFATTADPGWGPPTTGFPVAQPQGAPGFAAPPRAPVPGPQPGWGPPQGFPQSLPPQAPPQGRPPQGPPPGWPQGPQQGPPPGWP